MDRPLSTYKADFTQHSWIENNFLSSNTEFCSSENIDDCLKCISSELCALGYPSIYSSPSASPYAVNCDIVTLLNAIFELLKGTKDHAEVKDFLEERNHRLVADINALNKRNNQLKERLEQAERKYNNALEKERQLKEKNEHLQQLIKTEKDESKKLSSQIQHQKTLYQHEIRKYENRLTQMKARLNQILSDKNPDKKVANISSPHLLQRSTNQRGKWKTGSSVKSSTEEMFSSVISNYENRFEEVMKEIDVYRHYLQNIDHQLVEIVSLEQVVPEEFSLLQLNTVLNGQSNVWQRFDFMLSKIKEIVLHKISDNKNLLMENASFKIKLSQHEGVSKCKNSSQETQNSESLNENENNDLNKDTVILKEDYNRIQESLKREKAEIEETLAHIKEEKSKLEIQKLEMIKVAMKQKSSTCLRGTQSVPSFSIITTKSGLTTVPVAHQLKQCLSSPDQVIASISPLWKADSINLLNDSPFTSPLISNNSVSSSNRDSPKHSFVDDDLPKWARAALAPEVEAQLPNLAALSLHEESHLVTTNSVSAEEICISGCHSSEENDLSKLKAAFEDIENRRLNNMAK